MKILIIAIGLIIVIGAFAFSRLPSAESQSEVVSTDKENSDQKQSIGTPLYDVRTPEEFKSGYIESAVNLPLADIQNGKMPDEKKDEKIYVYCRSGNRSAQAKQLLEKAGFANVVDLGSINDVIKSGGKKVT
jgi:phage shock protein E